MKLKLYSIAALLTAVLLITNNANAQWTHSGTKTYLTNTGDNVGIGTTTPSFKLDIVSTTSAASLSLKSGNGNSSVFLDKFASNNTSSVSYRTNGVNSWTTGIVGTDNYTIKNIGLNQVAIFCNYANNHVGIGMVAPANALSVAGSADFSGNVGIGTTTPTATLNVVNHALSLLADFDGGNGMYISLKENGIYRGYIGSSSGAAEDVDFGTGFTNNTGSLNLTIKAIPKLTIKSDGEVGIGTTTPAYGQLDVETSTKDAIWAFTSLNNANGVSGTCNVGTNAYGVYGVSSTGWAGFFSGNVYSSGTYQGSDERLKENIMPAQNALEKVMKLEVKTYNFKNEYAHMNLSKGKQTGFIAQNLETVFPELVKTAADKSNPNAPFEFKVVNYVGMIPVLTEGIQELNQRLTVENAELKSRLDNLENAMAQCCSDYTSRTASDNSTSGARLEQNSPNPFTTNTVIRYSLVKSENAQIIIRDLSGNAIKSINIAQSGKGQVTVNANELTQGTYTYTLVVNGNAVDTKLMVITK